MVDEICHRWYNGGVGLVVDDSKDEVKVKKINFTGIGKVVDELLP